MSFRVPTLNYHYSQCLIDVPLLPRLRTTNLAMSRRYSWWMAMSRRLRMKTLGYEQKVFLVDGYEQKAEDENFGL